MSDSTYSKEIYNQLSDSYNDLFYKNIVEFQRRAKDFYDPDDSFVDFYPSLGIKPGSSPTFLFYGQATNGWDSWVNINTEITKEEKLTESILCSNKFCGAKDHTPLDWVNVSWTQSNYLEHMNDAELKSCYPPNEKQFYAAHKSFFWNIAFKTVCKYYGMTYDDWNWSRKMVWSNLYKIAPDGENPNHIQQVMQQPLSYDLVKQEIEELKPKYCVALTNLEWWLPFRYHLNTKVIKFDKVKLFHIASLEKYQDTVIIVTNRPRFGNHEEFVGQIIEIIKTKDQHQS